MCETQNIYDGFYGYEDEINELEMIKKWISSNNIINNEKLMIPQGIVFYGEPGCGKTLLMTKYANSFKAPTFIIEGHEKDSRIEIHNIFEKARKNRFSVIMIDEIDLLIDSDPKILRILQQELDGINQRGSILMLCTTNNLSSLGEALLRPGRLSKQIAIVPPFKETRIQMFKSFFLDLDENIDLSNICFDRVGTLSAGCTGADIRQIVNDAYLRCHNNLTTDEIDLSIDRVKLCLISRTNKEVRTMRTAIHEAGHSLLVMHFSNNWQLYKSAFVDRNGITYFTPIDEKGDSIERRKQRIMIALAGCLAEEIYFGHHDVGSYHDFECAHNECSRLIEHTCINGIDKLVPSFENNDNRYDTNEKRRKIEKFVDRTLKTIMRKTRKILIRNKKTLEKFANLLLEKGFVYGKDKEIVEIANLLID